MRSRCWCFATLGQNPIPTAGEIRGFTPTVEALYVPDVDSSLDEAPAKTQFWNAFKSLGDWWASLPPY